MGSTHIRRNCFSGYGFQPDSRKQYLYGSHWRGRMQDGWHCTTLFHFSEACAGIYEYAKEVKSSSIWQFGVTMADKV